MTMNKTLVIRDGITLDSPCDIVYCMTFFFLFYCTNFFSIFIFVNNFFLIFIYIINLFFISFTNLFQLFFIKFRLLFLVFLSNASPLSQKKISSINWMKIKEKKVKVIKRHTLHENVRKCK